MKQNIAVFGLGSMGFGIAASLVKAGHQVWGFDLSERAIQAFEAIGGKIAEFEVVAPKLDAVVLVVLNAQQAHSLLSEKPAICASLKPHCLVMNCTTISPKNAIDMANICGEHQLYYLDAPISGGAEKARQGKLSIMASGTSQAFEKANHFIDDIAQTVFTISDEAGAGSAMKSVNQMLAGVHIAAMAEAMTFAISQGIDARQCVEVISQSAGSSWMFENRAPHIVDGDYTPKSAINIWPKDLGIVMDIANEAKFKTPMAESALAQFKAAAEQGYGHEDDAALAKLYAAQYDIKLPNSV